MLVATLLAALHLAFSLGVNPPGYLTWDSGTYHYMAKTFAETGSFIVWNGYEEFPSPELVVAQLKAHDDHLVAQYPELLSVLVYPLYLLFGYHGLLLLEALAFLLVNALLFRLAIRLFDDRRLAWTGLFVYSFATFAWEYSQSSYPHLISTAFLLGAWVLLVEVLPIGGGARGGRAVALCLGAGVAAGMAIGLRLDAAFGVACLGVPFLFLRPFRWREVLALAAGFAPPMLFLSWTNLVKFDFFFPFFYGDRGKAYLTGDASWYLPMAILGAVLAVGLALWLRATAVWRRRAALAAVALGVVVALVFPAKTSEFVVTLADGTFQIVVDLRIRDLDIKEQGLERSAGGAMIYMGGVKKSFLQSCPYLILLVFPLIDALRRWRQEPEELTRLALLWLVPTAFIGFYSYLAWHGSVALNMRYLNPTLPFTSLLTARLLAQLREHLSLRWAAGVFVAVFVPLWTFCLRYRFSMLEQELWFLTAPLVVAGALLVAEGVRRLRVLPTLGGPLVAYGLIAAMAWSGAVAFGRDYIASTRVRSNNLVVADVLAGFLHDDILLATDFPDICWDLLDRFDRVRIAFPLEDDYETFEALASHHIAAGRAVYMATSSYGADQAMRRGILNPFEVQLVNTWQSGGRPTLVLFALRAPSSVEPEENR